MRQELYIGTGQVRMEVINKDFGAPEAAAPPAGLEALLRPALPAPAGAAATSDHASGSAAAGAGCCCADVSSAEPPCAHCFTPGSHCEAGTNSICHPASWLHCSSCGSRRDGVDFKAQFAAHNLSRCNRVTVRRTSGRPPSRICAIMMAAPGWTSRALASKAAASSSSPGRTPTGLLSAAGAAGSPPMSPLTPCEGGRGQRGDELTQGATVSLIVKSPGAPCRLELAAR